MKGLPLLLKLAQRRVDERREELGRITQARAEADAALAAHDAAADVEVELATANPQALAAFALWAAHAARLRTPLRERRDELERTEAAARETLRDAVAQAKRLEIAMDSAETVARRIAGRRELTRADEAELGRTA